MNQLQFMMNCVEGQGQAPFFFQTERRFEDEEVNILIG
jgi:hypothetical protein